MVSYIDNIVPTRVFAGEYTYETEKAEGGTFFVTFFIEGDRYQLRFPDGTEEQHNIGKLIYHRIRYNKIEQGLTQWLYMCLTDAMRLDALERFRPVAKNIVADGLVYRVEYFTHNDDLKITMPSRAFVCSRLVMSERYPDVHKMENGKVYDKIIDILASADIDLGEMKPREFTGYVFEFSNLEPIEIGRRTYIIEYDNEHDLIYLAHSSRIVMTQPRYFDKDAPELTYLHDGRVREALHEFLEENTIATT